MRNTILYRLSCMISWSLNYYNSIFVTVHKQKHDYIRIITFIRPVQSQFVSSIMRYPWIWHIYIHTHKFGINGSTWARILSILDRYAQLYALISKLACVRTILIRIYHCYHYYHVHKGKMRRNKEEFDSIIHFYGVPAFNCNEFSKYFEKERLKFF